MQRVYIEILSLDDRILEIRNPELLNQLIKVLRSKIGDEISFFNGKDNVDIIFEIIEIGKKNIIFEKQREINKNSEIDFNINLFQALPNKQEKIEYILQKGTEIGISNFNFFISERSQKINLSENKIERFKKIIVEASEQSDRNIIPKLNFIDKINFQSLIDDENIFCHTDYKDSFSLNNLKIDYNKKINIFIGPEGGLNNKELIEFETEGFKKLYLGKRILRTETAGIMAGFFIIQNKNNESSI